MKSLWTILLAAGVAMTFGCRPEGQRTETVETETRTEKAAGGEVVETETTAAGRVPDGREIDMKHQEFVGTVTEYKPGESLQIKAVDGETHSFDLDENDVQVSVDPKVKPGAKVAVTVHKEENQPQRITIKPAV